MVKLNSIEKSSFDLVFWNVSGGYRDNSLYAPCTPRMLQKLNSAKKRNVKESETTENVKKKADQCHNGSDVNPYSYVNFFVDFAAKGEETKVGNHKLKEDEQSQGKTQ